MHGFVRTNDKNADTTHTHTHCMQANALSLSQRMLLYAHDELDMGLLRMRIR